MLVEMTLQIGGTRDGVAWPPPGACIDVPDHEAADLIAAGYATEASKGAKEWDADTSEPGPDTAEDSGPDTASDGDDQAAEDSGTVTGDDAVRPAKPRKATAKRK